MLRQKEANMKGTKILKGMLALFLAISVTACGRFEVQQQDTSVSSETNMQEAESAEAAESTGTPKLLTLEEIPDKYLEPSDQPGQVVRIFHGSCYNLVHLSSCVGLFQILYANQR